MFGYMLQKNVKQNKVCKNINALPFAFSLW